MSEIKVTAAISGSIWQIVAAVGDSVSEDQPIIIMESMKMEIPLVAPKDGKIVKILVEPGQAVTEDDVVALIETA
jgi:acetyl-CoA carboxylase biotin carboxyl carrier protein